MTSTNTRGLFFLFAAFHLVWALVVYNFPSAVAHWLTNGSFDQIPSAKSYALVIGFMGVLGVAAALYPQATKRFLWIPLVLKVYEMLYAWIFVADMLLNPRMIFHLSMNGVLWLVIWILAWRRVVKSAS